MFEKRPPSEAFAKIAKRLERLESPAHQHDIEALYDGLIKAVRALCDEENRTKPVIFEAYQWRLKTFAHDKDDLMLDDYIEVDGMTEDQRIYFKTTANNIEMYLSDKDGNSYIDGEPDNLDSGVLSITLYKASGRIELLETSGTGLLKRINCSFLEGTMEYETIDAREQTITSVINIAREAMRKVYNEPPHPVLKPVP